VIARTLEREWNEKLEELDRIEGEYKAARHRQKLDLSEEDHTRILALAHDLPGVWNAPTTTHAERKNLLRVLVNEVLLSPVDAPTRSTRVQVLWQTGAVSEILVEPSVLAKRDPLALARRDPPRDHNLPSPPPMPEHPRGLPRSARARADGASSMGWRAT
jgi:hypothetical protein